MCGCCCHRRDDAAPTQQVASASRALRDCRHALTTTLDLVVDFVCSHRLGAFDAERAADEEYQHINHNPGASDNGPERPAKRPLPAVVRARREHEALAARDATWRR